MRAALAVLAVIGIGGAIAVACESADSDTGANGTSSSGSSGEGGLGMGGNSSSSGCADCTEVAHGVNTDHPFDPTTADSENVGLDDDGALILDHSQNDIPSIIWIANTGQNTVSKVDTTTYQELGRYHTLSVDPSRTSVNSMGDVFVGNRNGQSLTKISASGTDCPDTNGDGVINTSAGFNDVLAQGQDDCVLWNVPVPGNPLVRGVAAQDVIVESDIPDDPGNKIERYVWVGGTQVNTAYKFDGDTGQLLIQTPSPTPIYGLALDGDGQLWMSGNTGSPPGIGRIDTTKCTDQASCDAAPICQSTCAANGSCTCDSCPTGPCEEAIKERINLPQGVYGITVDFKQRVWVGGGAIVRYDKNAPAATRYAAIGGIPFIHGIAADGDGWVWGAGYNQGVIRVEGDTMQYITVPVPNAKGMAVDKDGKIWAVANGNEAHVIVGGNTLESYNTTTPAVTGLVSCYTYSDMTGQQFSLAAALPGFYREIFEGCPGDQITSWAYLDWDVTLETDTAVRFNARSADTLAELQNATWVKLASVPPAFPTVDIAAVFASKNTELGRYLELEVVLYGSMGESAYYTPHVNMFAVTHSCSPSVF